MSLCVSHPESGQRLLRVRWWEDGRVKRGHRPIVITDARQSPGEELRYRERRYVLMMSIRALCLVAAAVLVSAHAPLLWLWVPICLVGMVVVPWLAVILANDRLPRPEHRLLHRQRNPAPPERALGPAEEPRVIDADE
jgi:hypothetical protein